MNEETLTENLKKIVKWGKGLSIFITIEAKRFGWTDKDYVKISAIKDDEGEKIVIRKAVIK